MKPRAALALFLLLVIGGGLAIGSVTVPGGWYADLAKPSFNPPGYLFGPVWTLLYVMIAVAGWRVWKARLKMPLRFWAAQLALNFAWSPTFFLAHQIGLALAIILLMLATILVFIAATWRTERAAAWLFVPYAAWVAFASLLNGAIFALN